MSNKGVYTLNPTQATMKQGSKLERQRTTGATTPTAGRYAAQRSELESHIFPDTHPMMETRHSNATELKHADGRKHEDHHHAVKKLKGE